MFFFMIKQWNNNGVLDCWYWYLLELITIRNSLLCSGVFLGFEKVWNVNGFTWEWILVSAQWLCWVFPYNPSMRIYLICRTKRFKRGIGRRFRWSSYVEALVWEIRYLVWSSNWFNWSFSCGEITIEVCLREVPNVVWNQWSIHYFGSDHKARGWQWGRDKYLLVLKFAFMCFIYWRVQEAPVSLFWLGKGESNKFGRAFAKYIISCRGSIRYNGGEHLRHIYYLLDLSVIISGDLT